MPRAFDSAIDLPPLAELTPVLQALFQKAPSAAVLTGVGILVSAHAARIWVRDMTSASAMQGFDGA